MAVTEPGDLVNTAWDGDVPETKVTNEAASRPGFPARKADGTLVFIVDQFAVGHVKVLIDEHGNQYHDNQPTGKLTPVTDETSETISEDDVQPELDDGVEPETADDLPVASGVPVDGVEVQGGVEAVYDADAMDAITEQSVQEATPEETFEAPMEDTVEASEEDLTESA